MKIECSKEKFEKAVSLAERSTSKNPTLPILSCILLEAKGASLLVRSTNLDVGIEISIPAKIIKEGVVAVKGSTLLGFLSGITSNKQISLESDQNILGVRVEGGAAELKIFNSDDFPKAQKITGAVGVIIDGGDLSRGIRAVSYSASVSHIKPELASVVLYGDNKYMLFVATDSFRLAEKRISTETARDVQRTIIPIKNAIELSRVAEEFVNENVKLFFGKNQIAVEGKNIYFVSRLIDGSFPDYQQIIPKESVTEIVVLKEDLAQALKVSVVFSDSFNQITLTVSPTNKTLEVKAKNAEVGEGAAVIPAAISGEAISLNFNHRYFSDCLSSIKSDSVSISFSGAGKATVIRGVSDTSFLYIVMPMNR